MTYQQASRVFSASLKSRVQSESPEAVGCPAFTRAVEKIMDHVMDRELFFSALASDASFCCEFVLCDLPRLTDLEQVIVTGKKRDEWVLLFR